MLGFETEVLLHHGRVLFQPRRMLSGLHDKDLGAWQRRGHSAENLGARGQIHVASARVSSSLAGCDSSATAARTEALSPALANLLYLPSTLTNWP